MASVPFNYYQNIFIHDNPVAYRREVAKYLDLIRTTESGRTLIKFIKMSARKLLIKPYHPTAKNPVNAFAGFDIPLAAYPKGDPELQAVKLGMVGALLGVDPKAKLMVPTGDVGVGGGSPVTIEYHPATYRELIKRKRRIDPGDGPGEVLFHEMVHAMRAMFAKYSDTTVVENLRMDDFEEFCAILAQNIYRQERGFTSLRRDHWGHARLGGGSPRLRRLLREIPAVDRQMVRVPGGLLPRAGPQQRKIQSAQGGGDRQGRDGAAATGLDAAPLISRAAMARPPRADASAATKAALIGLA